MAYSKQNFQDGQILTAANLEKMENGIIAGQGAKNLLVNSNFKNPINSKNIQNGQVIGAWEPFIDKWSNFTDSELTVTFNNNGIICNKNIRQYLDPNIVKTEMTVTAAVGWSDGTVQVVSGQITRGSTWTWFYSGEGSVKAVGVVDEGDGSTASFVVHNNGSYTLSWAALYEGSYTVDTLPNYVPKPIQQEMLDCDVSLAPYNFLDNSDFTSPVNQNGASSYSGAVYTIDRWQGRVVAQTTEVRSTDIIITATGTSYAGIRQNVKDMPKLAGKTVTFAAKIYSNVAPELVFFNASGQALALKIGATNATQTLILTYTVPSNATADSVVPMILLRTTASGDFMSLYWAALYDGAYDASTLPPYVPKGKHVEMLNCNVPLTPHNLLDNSDFTNPVNQRGASSYSGYNYSIDRWYGSALYQTVSIQNNYITVSATGTSYCGIRQKLENMASLAGKTITFAAQIYSSVGTRLTFLDGSGNALATVNGAAGLNQTLILTYTVPSDATSDSVVPTIVCRTEAKGDSANIYWAALYEGSYDASTLPAYVPKGYAAELAECQRYYQFIPEQTSCAFSTSAQSNKYFASSINFPQMRIAPTVSLKKDSNGYIGVVQGVAFVSASEFDFAYKLNGTLLPATTNANYAGKVMSFYGIELNADL